MTINRPYMVRKVSVEDATQNAGCCLDFSAEIRWPSTCGFGQSSEPIARLPLPTTIPGQVSQPTVKGNNINHKRPRRQLWQFTSLCRNSHRVLHPDFHVVSAPATVLSPGQKRPLRHSRESPHIVLIKCKGIAQAGIPTPSLVVFQGIETSVFPTPGPL